jgi:flagellar hook-associated protein 2
MASISSIGIGSGVLTSDLIDDLVAVEREAADKRLDSQEELVTAQITELGTITSLAENLRAAASGLTLTSSFQSNIASSTNESALTATASSIADPGVYTIETTSLARAQTLATAEFSSLDSVLGEGELEFNFGDVDYDSGGPSFSFTADPEAPVRKVTIDASNHTLTGVRDAINDAEIGIRASIVDTGSGYRLLFESEETGENNAFTLTANNPSNGLDALNFNDATTTMLQTVAGSDAEFKVNGLDITRESNLVTGVISGLTLNLRQEGAGPVTLSVEPDTAAVTERMQTFVDAYNELKGTVNELTAFDPDTGLGSLFTGDSTVRNLISTSQRILGQFVSQLEGNEFRTLSEVGIKTNSETGQFIFDASVFQQALSSNAAGLTTLFGTTGSATDNLIDFVSGTADTQSGDYDIVISQLATQAQYLGMSTSGEPFVIDDSNDGFRISVDGTLSNNIVLGQGTFGGAELAELLQNSINSDANIQGAGRSVDVSYNASDARFEITSASYGSQSSVGFLNVDVNSALTLGLGEPEFGGHESTEVSALATTSDLVGSVTVNGGNDEFSLSVNGVSSNTIQIANGNYTNGDTLAQAIEDAINDDVNFKLQNISATVSFSADQEEGQFNVSFTQGNTTGLGFTALTADSGMANTLGLSAGGGTFEPQIGLDVTDTLGAALNDTAEFVIEANGVTSGTISVPIASSDGSDIAAALEAAIQADANFIASAGVAETAAGSLDISAGALDFTTTPRAVGLEYNGTRYDLVIDANGTAAGDIDGDGNTDFIDDTLQSVQDVIDATPGLAGNVVVDRNGTGLTFKTVATGIGETLNAVADGSGAKTALGASAITGAEDFTGNVTTFTLIADSTEFDITLDADPSASNTPAEVQAYIQAQIDTALAANSNFQAGDIVARLDAGNQLYFETVSKDGVSTTETIGTGATIEVKAGATDPLSILPAAGVYSSGFDSEGALDGFGHNSGVVRGQDLTQVSVTYDGGTEGGRFTIDFGNDVNFHVQSPNSFAASSLGLDETTDASFGYEFGLNVQGTINGSVALGTGQRLTGLSGTAAEGLRIDVTGGNLGHRGTVNFNRGIAEQLETYLDDLLDSQGGLGIKQTGLQDELSEIAEERLALDERIEQFQARLASQFSFNDSIIQQLNTTQDFLKQQFDILAAALKQE